MLACLQDLQQSQSREAELQASADEFQCKLAREAGLCRDLTSDLNRTKAELAGAQGELEERAEESEALTQQVQQLQVTREISVLNSKRETFNHPLALNFLQKPPPPPPPPPPPGSAPVYCINGDSSEM